MIVSVIITLLLAAIVGYIVKLIVGTIASQFADTAGLVAFLLVCVARIGGNI